MVWFRRIAGLGEALRRASSIAALKSAIAPCRRASNGHLPIQGRFKKVTVGQMWCSFISVRGLCLEFDLRAARRASSSVKNQLKFVKAAGCG